MDSQPDAAHERKQQLLAAATVVFAEYGFERATIDDIVAEAGLSKGTLYWYYDSKEDLITELLDALLNREFDQIQTALPTDRPASQQLLFIVNLLIDDLPSAYREALTLTEIDGLTQAEMGRRLGLSLSGAKSRVQRGRAIVRDQLLDCCHVELDRRRHIIDYEPAAAEPWPEDCSCAPGSEQPIEFIQR